MSNTFPPYQIRRLRRANVGVELTDVLSRAEAEAAWDRGGQRINLDELSRDEASAAIGRALDSLTANPPLAIRLRDFQHSAVPLRDLDECWQLLAQPALKVDIYRFDSGARGLGWRFISWFFGLRNPDSVLLIVRRKEPLASSTARPPS